MMNDDKMIQVSYGSTNIAEVFLLICPKRGNSLVLLVRDSSVHEGVEYTSEYKVINPNNSEFKDFIDSICNSDINELIGFAEKWLTNMYTQCWWGYDAVAKVRSAVLLMSKTKDRRILEDLISKKFVLPKIRNLNYDDLTTYLYEFTEGLHQSAKASEIFNNEMRRF